ncbi:hypothetical protein [Dactylosporangium matsuzakiense]|uniref:hypothetical protein n=1 Tax=Dactylosporangium matsuzakiense TaxID=53360 RepID=UPI0022F34312|nr:hypothetical protein [Dactylosporangium matsuzakiense]
MYVLAVIEHANRRVLCATAAWVTQAAKNLVMDLEDAGCWVKYLIRDRDSKFPALFDAVLEDASVEVVLSGIRMPHMNAIMERWVQTCRREVLDRTLIWNQRHLLHEYERFYNEHSPTRASSSPGLAQQVAGGLDGQQRLQLRERGVDHLLCFGSWSAFSGEQLQERVCFAMISNAALSRAGSAARRSFCRRSRSISACSAVLPRFGAGVAAAAAPAVPPRVPASRARRHSMVCEEYRPSRRNMAPFSPAGKRSYSTTIVILYSAVNERRRGRSARGPGSAPIGPSSARTVPESATVKVTVGRSSLALVNGHNESPDAVSPDPAR